MSWFNRTTREVWTSRSGAKHTGVEYRNRWATSDNSTTPAQCETQCVGYDRPTYVGFARGLMVQAKQRLIKAQLGTGGVRLNAWFLGGIGATRYEEVLS